MICFFGEILYNIRRRFRYDAFMETISLYIFCNGYQNVLYIAERMLISLTAKNKVELRIAGKDYSVVGTEPVEYIHRVGLYVDRKMTEILRLNNKLSTSLAAVLTAINVVDDLFKCKESEHNLKISSKRPMRNWIDWKKENKPQREHGKIKIPN